VRVGYLIVPAALVDELQARAASTYLTPGLVGQATLHEFLRRGLFESNLERVRGLLRERRDAMLEALESDLGGRARWSHPEGGYFLWLELSDEIDASELLVRSSGAGVTFVPGADFGGEPNTMRLAFSYVSAAEITEGIGRLANLVASAAAPV
jgi:DNA-binding transcriptional MocR family regulator